MDVGKPKSERLLDQYLKLYKESSVPEEGRLRVLLKNQSVIEGENMDLIDDIFQASSGSGSEEKSILLTLAVGSILNALCSKDDLNLNSNTIVSRLDGIDSKMKEFSSSFKGKGGTPSTLLQKNNRYRQSRHQEMHLDRDYERSERPESRSYRKPISKPVEKESNYLDAILHNQDRHEHGLCFFYDNGKLVKKTVF